MAVQQVNPQGSSRLAAFDPIWDRVRGEAEDIVRREPELATFIYSTVLHHSRLEDSVIHRLADRVMRLLVEADVGAVADPGLNFVRAIGSRAKTIVRRGQPEVLRETGPAHGVIVLVATGTEWIHHQERTAVLEAR